MVKAKDECVKPALGPIVEPEAGGVSAQETSTQKTEERKMSVRVGKPAPDFEAHAYIDGGFKSVRLSDHKNKWVVICFYPGDFTFV